MIRLGVALIFLLFSLGTKAQEVVTPPTKVAIQDFSHAVDLLVKAGFPDTKGARYVKVKLGYNTDSYSPFTHFDKKPKLTGIAWFIPGDSDQKGTLALGMGISAPFTVGKPTANQYFQQGQPYSSTISDADISKDLETVHKWLLNKGYAQVENYGDDYADTNLVPPIFSFAVMAHRAGHTEPANALIHDILTRATDPNVVIDTVINSLAENENNAAYAALVKSGDWEAYLVALQQLEKKYPRGWKSYDALSILLPQVQHRATAEPTVPIIEGIEFKPEVAALLKQTNTSKQLPATGYTSNPSWLFNGKSAMQNSKSPFAKLTEHGLDGFIGLVALLDDNTLILQETSQNNYYGGRYYSSYDDPAELAYRAYKSMTRPKTRGEVAFTLLKNYFSSENDDPFSSSNSNYDTQAELKQVALKWYKQHKDDTPMELCQYFLSSGNQNLLEEIVGEFINIGTEESYATLEKIILESSTPSMFAIQIKPYIIKRRQAAKPFLEQFAAKLTNEIGDGKESAYENSGQNQISRDGGTEKFIAKLTRFTEPASAKQLITKLSRKSANTEEILEQLRPELQGKPLGKLRPKLIYAAAKSSPEKAAKIIQFALGVRTPPETKEQAYEVAINNFEKEDWQKLLGFSETFTRDGFPLQTATYFLLDATFNPKHDYTKLRQICSSIAPEKIQPWLKSQTELLLSQKDPAPYPLAATVAQERVEELISEFSKSHPTEIQVKFNELSIAETLALKPLLLNSDITSVNEAQKLINHFAIWDDKDSKVQNKDTIRALVEGSGILYSEIKQGTIAKIADLFKENLAVFDGTQAGITKYHQGFGYALYYGSTTDRSNIIPDDKLDALAKTKNSHLLAFSWTDPSSGRWHGKPTAIVTWSEKQTVDTEHPEIKKYLNSLENSPYIFTTLQLTTSENAEAILDTQKGGLQKLRQQVMDKAVKSLGGESIPDELMEALNESLEDASIEELEEYLKEFE